MCFDASKGGETDLKQILGSLLLSRMEHDTKAFPLESEFKSVHLSGKLNTLIKVLYPFIVVLKTFGCEDHHRKLFCMNVWSVEILAF